MKKLSFIIFTVTSLFFLLTVISEIHLIDSNKWILVTEDYESHTSPFYSIYFFDTLKGVAITNSKIIKTENGGITWKVCYENEDTTFNSITFINENNGIVVGTEGNSPLVMKTDDQGNRWQKWEFTSQKKNYINENFKSFFDVCFSETGKGWIVGNKGIIEVNTDGTFLDSTEVYLTEQSLFSVDCSKSVGVWAVGEKGAVFNFNGKWDKRTINYKHNFNKVKIIENEIWILGGLNSKGLLIRSQNNGETWENLTPTSSTVLFDIYLNEKKGWIVGDEGNIFFTDNNGILWTKANSPTRNALLKIFFVNSNKGWIVGDKKTVLSYGSSFAVY